VAAFLPLLFRHRSIRLPLPQSTTLQTVQTPGVIDDKHYLRVSHWLTLLWGVIQIGVALIAMRQNARHWTRHYRLLH